MGSFKQNVGIRVTIPSALWASLLALFLFLTQTTGAVPNAPPASLEYACIIAGPAGLL